MLCMKNITKWSEHNEHGSGGGAWVNIVGWGFTSSNGPSSDVRVGLIEFWIVPVVDNRRWLRHAWFDSDWDDSSDDCNMWAWAWVDIVGRSFTSSYDPSSDVGESVIKYWVIPVVDDWGWLSNAWFNGDWDGSSDDWFMEVCLAWIDVASWFWSCLNNPSSNHGTGVIELRFIVVSNNLSWFAG